jgi:hypothetical protein
MGDGKGRRKGEKERGEGNGRGGMEGVEQKEVTR